MKAADLKCCICDKTITELGALYRVNAVGLPGVWACAAHLKNTDAPPSDSRVRALIRLLDDLDEGASP